MAPRTAEAKKSEAQLAADARARRTLRRDQHHKRPAEHRAILEVLKRLEGRLTTSQFKKLKGFTAFKADKDRDLLEELKERDFTQEDRELLKKASQVHHGVQHGGHVKQCPGNGGSRESEKARAFRRKAEEWGLTEAEHQVALTRQHDSKSCKSCKSSKSFKSSK